MSNSSRGMGAAKAAGPALILSLCQLKHIIVVLVSTYSGYKGMMLQVGLRYVSVYIEERPAVPRSTTGICLRGHVESESYFFMKFNIPLGNY